MKRYLLITCLLLTACTTDRSDPAPSEEKTTTQKEGVLATNFDTPWSIASTEDSFYITERDGKLFHVDMEGNVTAQNLTLSSSLFTQGEAGLLGFTSLDTDEAYVYYSYEGENGPSNRVAKLKRTEDTWNETDIIIDHIPAARIHNGGRLEEGPDGHIFITTGDAATPDLAQDKESLAGKILRMNKDGSIPEDNPFSGSYVYSYGHRNPQGVAWMSDGTMYSAEHGENAKDEINLIEPGNNYGWPVIEGEEKKEGMVAPSYHTGDTTWAPSGIASHEDKLYIAALRGERLIAFTPETRDIRIVSEAYGRVRDLFFQGEDGYGITSNRDGRGNPDEEDDIFFRFTP